MTRPNSCIDEELVCIDSVRRVLGCTLGLSVGVPTRVEPGEDPPDFWLQIDGTQTPVEVTSIVQRAAFNHHAREMARVLKKRAIDANILYGTYVLEFRQFPPIPHPRRDRDQPFYVAALDYIGRTASVDEYDELDIYDGNSGNILLKKLRPNGETVCEMLTHSEWEVQSQDRIRDLVDAAAQSKIKKLHKNGIASQDSILALYDAYACIEFDEVVQCTAGLASLAEFGAVFWASAFAGRENYTYLDQPGRDGGFVTSSVREWCGVNSIPTIAESGDPPHNT